MSCAKQFCRLYYRPRGSARERKKKNRSSTSLPPPLPRFCLYSSRNESRYRLSMMAYYFFACKWAQRLYSLIESSSAASAEDKFRVRPKSARGVRAGRGTGIDRLGVQDRQRERKHNVRKETSGAVPSARSPLLAPLCPRLTTVTFPNPFCR